MWIIHTILIGYAHLIDLSLQDDWASHCDVIEPPIVNHSIALPDVSNSENYVFRISSVTSPHPMLLPKAKIFLLSGIKFWELISQKLRAKTRPLCGKVKPFAMFRSVQSFSCVWLFATPRMAAHQASLSFTISQNLLKVMSIESVMPPTISSSVIHFSSFLQSGWLLSLLLLSQHQGLFQLVSSSHQVAKVLELQLQYQSLQWIFRNDFL